MLSARRLSSPTPSSPGVARYQLKLWLLRASTAHKQQRKHTLKLHEKVSEVHREPRFHAMNKQRYNNLLMHALRCRLVPVSPVIYMTARYHAYSIPAMARAYCTSIQAAVPSVSGHSLESRPMHSPIPLRLHGHRVCMHADSPPSMGGAGTTQPHTLFGKAYSSQPLREPIRLLRMARDPLHLNAMTPHFLAQPVQVALHTRIRPARPGAKLASMRVIIDQ